ncbi:MAG TPA: RNA polymerase sigma factor [Ktedonobacterales bacterium]|nr:RNA polymerase sigma factor [Ktedonobacterales bacterium]
MDDMDAIARCQRGDIEGLAALIRRYEASALRLAYLLTGDRFLAEDIVQDSFLQAYHALPRFQGGRPFLPWFQQIVTNTTRMRMRSTRRRREISLSQLVGEEVGGEQKESLVAPRPLTAGADTATNPAARAEQIEDRAAIGQALAALTEKQREAVALRYYFAYSDQEIADILGCPVNTARHRVYDGLHALERVIRQRFPWLLSERGGAPGALPDAPATRQEGASSR